jgi:hypothetical protein
MPVRATLWLLILAVLLGLAAHAPVRHAAFQFDDFPAVVENPALQTPFRLGDLLRPSAAGADYVRPVLFLTYRACDALAGVSTAAADLGRRAQAQHVGNLVLHILNGLLVYAWGRGLARRAGEEQSAAPAIAALLYAVHPALSEGVNYVAGRSSVLVTTWTLLAVWLALSTPASWPRQLGALIATALALGSKEVALVIPALVLVSGRMTDPRRRWPWRAAAGPALFTALALFLWRGHASTAFQPPLLASWLMGVRAAARYAELLLVPSLLSVDYGWVPPAASAYWPWSPNFERAALAQFALGAALLLALLSLAIFLGRRRPLVAAGSAWFGLALLPNVAFPIRDPIFEHRLVLAAPGLLLAIADLGALLGEGARFSRMAQRLLIAALAGLLIVFAYQSRHRAHDWSSEHRLWADDVVKQPANPRAAFNLAAAMTAELATGPYDRGLAATATALYRRALALHPALAYGYELRAYAATNLGYLEVSAAHAILVEDALAIPAARGHLARAIAVLDSATTYRVRSGSRLVPYPEAYENLAAALLLEAQLAAGDPAASAGAAVRAERAIAVAYELAPTAERQALAQAIAQFRARAFVDAAPGPR